MQESGLRLGNGNRGLILEIINYTYNCSIIYVTT